MMEIQFEGLANPCILLPAISCPAPFVAREFFLAYGRAPSRLALRAGLCLQEHYDVGCAVYRKAAAAAEKVQNVL